MEMSADKLSEIDFVCGVPFLGLLSWASKESKGRPLDMIKDIDKIKRPLNYLDVDYRSDNRGRAKLH